MIKLQRNRQLQIVILAFMAFTIYTYYRSAVFESHQFSGHKNQSRIVAPEPVITQAEPQAEPIVSEPQPLVRNLTADTVPNPSYNAINTSSITLITSTKTQSVSSTNPVSAKVTKILKSETNIYQNVTSIPINKNATRMFTELGHSVAVPENCPNQGLNMDLMIIIMSAPINMDARRAIRQTWGHFGQQKDIGIVFMLGATVNSKVEKILTVEQSMYGDIVRGKFLDSYSNLTLKTVSTLEWVDTYCSKARFVLKTDDDMFINVPLLVQFIRKHKNEKNVIFGRLAERWKPIRNKKSKYYIPAEQYKYPVFPNFTTGPAYLMSSDIIHKLFLRALDEMYLKLEDVYTTGIVAHKLGIRRIHSREFLNKKTVLSPCNIKRQISIHMVKYSEQFDLWKKLLDGKTKCK